MNGNPNGIADLAATYSYIATAAATTTIGRMNEQTNKTKWKHTIKANAFYTYMHVGPNVCCAAVCYVCMCLHGTHNTKFELDLPKEAAAPATTAAAAIIITEFTVRRDVTWLRFGRIHLHTYTHHSRQNAEFVYTSTRERMHLNTKKPIHACACTIKGPYERDHCNTPRFLLVRWKAWKNFNLILLCDDRRLMIIPSSPIKGNPQSAWSIRFINTLKYSLVHSQSIHVVER